MNKYLLIVFSAVLFCSYSCSRGQKKVIPVVDPPVEYKAASRVNVFIENSGSMNGYVNGDTEFKTAMADLLVMLDFHYGVDSVFLNFINTAVYPVKRVGSATSFAKQLTPKNFKVGNVGSTDLNDIFKIVLAKTDSSSISILLSDCIYSIKGVETTHLLGIAKAETKNAFLQNSKRASVGYTTTVVQLLSDFNGNYYDRNDHPHVYQGKRPYYMCVIGAADAMADFNQVVPLQKEKLKGFEHSYTLSTNKADMSTPFWSVLPATSGIRFNPIRELSSKEFIRGIEDIELNDRYAEGVEIRVAVDMSAYPVDESYLTSPLNYTVSGGDFSVMQVLSIGDVALKPTERRNVGSATHLIFLKANGNAYSDIELRFKNTIPEWVAQSHCIDDVHEIDRNSTFGLQYMVEGIAEAYATQNKIDSYCVIGIPISKSAGFSFFGVLGVILGIAGAAFLGLLIYNRNKQ